MWAFTARCFREREVRLIAVNDNIDTARGDDDFTPFREIMAEWYARDTSKKIKSVFAAKAKSGKPTASTPPYGFIKDPNDKNKWLVDHEAATVVKRIFQMTMDGMGVHKIAGVLAAERIERPSHYLGRQGRGRHKNDYNIDLPYAWGSASIANILRKHEYAGHLVNLRTTSTDFKSNKKKNRPQEEWLIFPHAHEAIVDQETFDIVQKLRETPRRIDTMGEANPLTGLLWCADCNAKMYNHRKAKTEKPTHKKLTDVYHCSTYKLSNSKFQTKCTSHHISTHAVNEIILDVIRKTCWFVREQEALYEDKALGKIKEDIFNQMAEGYQQERVEIREKIETLQAELDAFNEDSIRADKFLEMVRRYTNFDILTPAMLHEFVDRVIIHEGQWSDGNTGEGGRPRGTRTQQVDVYLKYIGSFDVPDMRTAEQIESDRIAEEKLQANRAYHREKTRQCAERKRKREAASENKPTPAA